MMHGYAKGCRCSECREKHRETQMKYRKSLANIREAKKISDIEDWLHSEGINRGPLNERLADQIYRVWIKQ
jgi:hypothetical protein